MDKNRVKEIDILKGIAIFFMVVANYSPYYVADPHFLLRLIYTFAAPLFVAISGFLTYLNKIRKNYNWKYYFTRGFILIIIACMVDIFCFKSYPFFSFDILYLLGFCNVFSSVLFIVYQKFSFSILLIFLLTFLVQKMWGYEKEVVEHEIYEKINIDYLVNFKQFLIDGYFPILPWLGIFMLGFIFFEEKYKEYISKWGYISIFLFPVFSFWLLNTDRFIRAGYAELFYPPDYVFIFWTINFLVLSFYLLYRGCYLKMGVFSKYFEIIGKSSLFFYVFHLFFIEYFLEKIKWSRMFLGYYSAYFNLFFSYFTTLILIGLIALLFEQIKKKCKNLHFIVKFFIGT